MSAKIRIIGLTGGIATGKSTAARFFAERGIPVVDADQLARDAVSPGSSALGQIVGHFGEGVLTPEGFLDRKRLGSMIFSDPGRRRLLEGILHPAIRQLADEAVARAAAAGHQRIVYMAPLLIEAGAIDRVDTVWVVTVRPEIQLERLMKRDGINREQAQLIIGSQMPLHEKERFGDAVIDNSGSETETLKALAALWSKETGNSDE